MSDDSGTSITVAKSGMRVSSAGLCVETTLGRENSLEVLIRTSQGLINERSIFVYSDQA